MKYHELVTHPRSNKKRVGRGIAAGQGKTAGRGTKGQNSRTGSKLRVTFMGGQGLLVQRIPKARGFKSIRVPKHVVYLDQLAAFKSTAIDNHTLYKAGLIPSPYHGVKIVSRGELNVAVTARVQAASKGAEAAIEKAGGSFEKVPVPLKIKQAKKADAKK